MIKNIQVRTYRIFHDALSSWIGAGAPPQCVVCVGITPNDELLIPALAVVDYVPHFLGWWWFI
jgi:hypothetical protein